MSFATAPSVTRAMHERIDHPFFGYYFESDAYYQAIIDWHRSRKGVSQNVVSMHALIGAYSDEGATWADELCQVLSENASYAHHKLSSYPGVTCAHPEGTYVLLADCRAWCDEHGVSYADFPRLGWDVGVTWHDGRLFEYPGCVRLAVSVPHSQVIEAFDRLDRYVFC